ILELDDIRIGVENFGVTFGESVVFNGTIFVASGGATFLPGKPISAKVTDRASEPPLAPGVPDTEAIRLGLEFENGKVKSFIFDADTLEINLGSFLTLTARDLQINTGAEDDQELVSFGAVGAEVKIGSLIIGGEARNFAFLGNGKFVTKAGFGVFLSVGGATGDGFKWPKWLPIRIDEIGIIWDDIQADPADFKLILSASVTGIQGVAGLEFSGSVRGIVIDIGLLRQGKFPVVDIAEIGVSVEGKLFGGELKAALIGGIIKLDATGQMIDSFDTITPVQDRVFFVGVEGSFSMAGLAGFGIRFAMSELGPLGVLINVDIPIMIVPQIGLTISDFTAGVEFFKTLPEIDDPEQLRDPAFDPPGEISVDQWLSSVRQQVVTQYQQIQANPGRSGFAAAFTSPMLITGGAKLYSAFTSQAVFNAKVTIRFSTDGKFLAIGTLNFAADNLSITAKLYANMSKIASGEATVLFLATIPDQARLLSIDGFFKMGFREESGKQVTFTTVDAQGTQPYARLAGPNEGGAIGVGTINGLSYIDVELPTDPDPTDTSVSGTLVASSVTDSGEELRLVINGTNGSTLAIDNSQGATHVSGNTFRFWLKGSLKSGDTFDLMFLKGTFSYVGPDGADIGFEGGAFRDPDGVWQNDTPISGSLIIKIMPYVDVQFVAGIGNEIDFDTLSASAISGAMMMKLTRKDGSTDDDIMSTGNQLLGGGKVRYFFAADSFEAGQYDVTFAGGVWSDTGGTMNGPGSGMFEVVMPVAEVSGPFNNNNTIVDVHVANASTALSDKFIDVTYRATPGAALDYASIMDAEPEFTATGLMLAGGAPTPIVFVLDDMGFGSYVEVLKEASETNEAYYQRLSDEGVVQFRYGTTGAFSPANVTIVFTPDKWGDTTGNLEEGTTYEYVIEGPTVRLANPGDGANVDIGQLNGRNYIDVLFPDAPSGYVINPASLADAAPEFTLSGPGLGSIKLDGGAPWDVDGAGSGTVYRYWVSGEFADSLDALDQEITTEDIIVTFIADSWSYFSENDYSSDVELRPTTDNITLDNASFISVDFDTAPDGYVIDPDSITDLAAEFSLSYSGQNFAKTGTGTIALSDIEAPQRIGDSNVYRFAVTGDFAVDGTQTVTLVFDKADPWAFTSSAVPLAPYTVPDAETDNNRTYIDLLVMPSMQLDMSMSAYDVVAPTSGITLAGNAASMLTLDASTPIAMGNGVYRYIATGQFDLDVDTNPEETGLVTVTIAMGVVTDTSAAAGNRETAQRFYVQGPTATLAGPGNGEAIGIASQNKRGFIDVTFGFPDGTVLDLATLYDVESIETADENTPKHHNAEFVLDPATGLELDDSQAPVLISQVGSMYTMRYFTLGTYTSGEVIVTLIPGSFGFADGTLSTSADPIVVSDPTTANVGYIDIAYQPTAGYVLDVDSITDSTPEFALVGEAADAVTLSDSAALAPLRLTESNTYRYFLSGDFAAGNVTVEFEAGSFQSTATDDPGPDTGLAPTGPDSDPIIKNIKKTEGFTVQILTADLAEPAAGVSIDAAALANRGFIDVTFTLPSYATSIDLATVLDLDPEFSVSVPEGTFELDGSQAPQFIGDEDTGDYTFRYFYVGTFTGEADVTITFIGNSFDYQDTGGERIPNFADQVVIVQQDSEGLYILVDFGESLLLDESGVDATDLVVHTSGVTLANGSQRGPPELFRFNVSGSAAVGDEVSIGFANGGWSYGTSASVVADPVVLSVLETYTYIDIRFNTAGTVAIDDATIDGDEFTISGPGMGTATLVDYAALADPTLTGPMRLGDSNVFRYFIDRGETGFAPGALLVSFEGDNWADELGNMGEDETESFMIIEVLQNALSGDSEAAAGRIFFIEIGGGIALEALGFTDEPIIEMRAKVVLEFGNYDIAIDTDGDGLNDSTTQVTRFSIDASGTIKIIKLGNIGSAAARFVLQTGDTPSGGVEFWGIVKIQANLDFLKNYGIFIEASAMLQINVTDTEKVERLALEGIPGDILIKDTGLSTSGLSTSVLGEVEIDALTGWSAFLATVDADPTTAATDQVEDIILTTDAIVRTIIVGQKWKIITKTAEGKFGPSYFATINSDGGIDLRTEYQTFKLEAKSFAIEILGSLKIKEGGSSDPNAPDAIDMFGGFYLKITPTRFELFVQSSVRVVPLGISGDAVGLVIIDGRIEGPGIPGIALFLNVELSVGAPPDAGDDEASVSALEGIFQLEGKVRVTMNTTLREQVFNVPQSFQALLPDDAPTVVTIYDNAPEIDGARATETGVSPSIYVSASIEGAITLFDTITLTGFIGFTASVDFNGNAFVRISAAVSTKIKFIGALSGSLDLLFYTNKDGMGPGIIGRIQLALADEGNIPGIEINGQFLIEVNSFASAQTIRSFQTNAEADPGYTGTQGNILATDPDTGLFVIGDVTIENGFRIVLQGKLVLGPVVEIEGRFELSISSTHLEIKALAKMKLFGIGEFEINAVMRIDATGFALYVDLSIGADFGEDIGLSFSVEATLEIYIGSLAEKHLTLADGTPIVVKQGFKLRLAGEVTFLGFASASGMVTITMQAGVFSIEFDVMLSLGPLSIAARGGAAIYTDSNPGMALVLDVSVEANLFEVIKIKAAGTLQMNLSGQQRTLAGITMAANSFKIALYGEVKFLEVLTFEASFVLEVGYEGTGSWRVEFSASLNFFGLAQMSAYGMFNYKGHFDISLDGGFTLGTSSFGLVAKFHFRVAFGEREVADTPGLTEYFFLVEASGSASLRAFGITFASISIGFKIEAAGEGRVPLIVNARASVKILFIRIS
ncbi:MAG: hypothetical protein KJO55_08905, partial [Gammaproteobacteria bacterium]|nr:hypothetical protein [Gammaproteobacteria bacterium]